jgi:type II secretory pathway pseudopilin PulG
MLACIAMGALCLSVVLSLVGISSEDSYRHLAQHAAAGQYVSLQSAQSADHRVHMIALLNLGLLVVTGAAFIAWFRSAYTNVERLGVTGMRWSPGWAVGAWFVPFLALVRPKAILNDIWRGSDPRLPSGGSLGQEKPPVLYAFWWGLWLLSSVIAGGTGESFQNARTLSALSSATGAMMFSDVLSVIAAILAIAVIYSIDSRQRRRAEAVDPFVGLPSHVQDLMRSTR